MQEKLSQLKKDILNASYNANACHIGSALSCVEILVDILYKQIKKKDVFIFGKASGVVAYYAILADQGVFPKDKIAEYLSKYPLPSEEVPGVEFSFGSLGHALPVAVGMAYADRTRGVWVLLSDGECQEGSTLEAVQFAGQHNLTNLHVFVDNNGLQANGSTKDIIDMNTTWNFMFETLPDVEIIDTVKGAGVDFMENDYTWHYKNLTEDELKAALTQV